MEEQLQIAMQAYREYCMKKANAIVKDWLAAEEIVQDVFLAYANNQQAFNGTSSLKTYLVRITHNKAVDYLRRKKEILLTDEPIEIPIHSLEEYTVVAEERHALKQALSELPSKYRDTLYYYYYENYNIPQIAKLASESENTIKTRLVRGRKKLKGILQTKQWELMCS